MGMHEPPGEDYPAAQQHDYLITGHTHVPHDRQKGAMRWVNPGALSSSGSENRRTLNTQTDTLTTLKFRS